MNDLIHLHCKKYVNFLIKNISDSQKNKFLRQDFDVYYEY